MYNQRAYYNEHRVRFEFRKSQIATYPIGTIYAYIKVEGQPIKHFSTSIKATREVWDSRTTPRRSPAAKALNEQLVHWEDSIRQAARTLFDRGDAVTAEALLQEKNYTAQPLLTLEQVFEKFLAFKKSMVSDKAAPERLPKQIAPSTYRTYSNRWKWVRLFLKSKRSEKLLIQKVDAPLVHAFAAFLTTQPVGAAFATSCVKLLTEVCQWAFNAGHIRELRTGSYRGTSVAENPPFNLSETEVEILESLDLSSTQALVRDGWLLARELCLHYSDYRELSTSHFSRDIHGRLVFDKFRVKQESGRKIRQVSLVSERAEHIWHQYGQKIPASHSDAHFSRTLTEIGQLAGLEQRLKFSHARDSGIFRYVASGCPEIQTKLAAGWTSSKQLIRYVNHDRRVLESLNAVASPKGGSNSGSGSAPLNPFSRIHKAS